jgi:hypothetical protein
MALPLDEQPRSLFRPAAIRHRSRGAIGRPLLNVGVGLAGSVAFLLLVVSGIAVLMIMFASKWARA